MNMPITVHIIDIQAAQADLDNVFDYFTHIENVFSVFKKDSEISKINREEINVSDYSHEVKEILILCEKTKQETNGFFDIIEPSGRINPSGLVKGWAIYQAANMLKNSGFHNYFVDAGGDIQVSGRNENGEPWNIGIRNPFNVQEIIKTIHLKNNEGIATSGVYERGNHIYNPHDQKDSLNEIVSITVIGPNIYEADRFATPAFAMGRKGIDFIEKKENLEGYIINTKGIATYTSGFEKYLK